MSSSGGNRRPQPLTKSTGRQQFGGTLMRFALGTPPLALTATVSPAALAPYSAASARLEGDSLVLDDLEPVGREAHAEALAGRVLIRGDRRAFIALVAHERMARAVPLRGQERPGATLRQLVRPGRAAVAVAIPLTAPVRVKLIFLGAEGDPSHPREVIVRVFRVR